MMSSKSGKKLIETLLILIVAFLAVYYKDITNVISTSVEENNGKVNEVINLDGNLLRVYFIDVGQADCILIENNHEYVLIDGGNNEDGPKLVNYFEELGISKFKLVVGTHAHEDHIGGLDDILENFDTEQFFMPDVVTTTKTFEDVLNVLEKKNIVFQTPTINSEVQFNNMSLKVLSVKNDNANLNDSSIVLKLKYGTTSFLFMGDASIEIENEIMLKEIKSDVLKVGHHGSSSSTSLKFLKRVSPTFAIISVGKNNNYQHPNEIILNRLIDNNVKTFRTDENGTIIAESNGTIINFKTIKTNTNG